MSETPAPANTQTDFSHLAENITSQNIDESYGLFCWFTLSVKYSHVHNVSLRPYHPNLYVFRFN